MHFDDLTSYTYYTRGRVIERACNIGWLDSAIPFRTGIINPTIPQLLTIYYDALCANQMRGYYGCPLCPSNGQKPAIHMGPQSIVLGAAELWVPCNDGRILAAPDLIIHYMAEHQYMPPDQFIQAVESLPVTIVGWNGEAVARALIDP